jgi:transposase
MDNNTLEILLDFSELSVSSARITKSRIELDCQSKFEENICPSCLKKCKKITSVTTRQVRDMSILGKEVYLNLESRQFHCGDCSRYFQEQFSFVKSSKTQTIRLEQYLYCCLKTSSFKQVSVRENILWDVLQDLFTCYSQWEIKSNLDYFPTRIGIDETVRRCDCLS